MQIGQFVVRLVSVVMPMALGGWPAAGQVVVVGTDIRNGSFESGAPAPWGGVDVVTQNMAFASAGTWFALLAEVANTTTARTDS